MEEDLCVFGAVGASEMSRNGDDVVLPLPRRAAVFLIELQQEHPSGGGEEVERRPSVSHL